MHIFQVSCHMALDSEGFFTHRTAVRHSTSVHSHVTLQIIIACKSFVTDHTYVNSTLEWASSPNLLHFYQTFLGITSWGVSKEMLLQHLGLCESFGANVTPVL